MRQAISNARLRLWRMKVRARPQPAPPPVPSVMPPLTPRPGDGGTGSAERTDAQGANELLNRYVPTLDGLTLLQLGCGSGELLDELARGTSAARLIGVNRTPHQASNGAPPGRVERDERVQILTGDLAETELPAGPVDVVLCDGLLAQLAPEAVHDTLAACFSLMRPGGSLLVRTALCTAPAPADEHRLFAAPYTQLLLGERDLNRLARARFDRKLPYLNWLTATSYVILFHQAGFEALDVRRIHDTEHDRARQAILERSLPGASDDEFASAVEAHLVRPFTLEDLAQAGEIEDTRPDSVRNRAPA
jgi:2-polyprenyl-3-methyl-5-hydroxy-6-metoxy-1,4-benzoquinol methylase